MQDAVEPLAHALEYEGEDPPLLKGQGKDQATVPSKAIAKLFNNEDLRVIMRKVAGEKAERICTSEVKATS